MKTGLASFLAIFFLLAPPALADVKVTQKDDCFRVEVDGKLFTEWQMKAWAAPYLYPVIGPNGENITRHYPMKAGVPGEQNDHPHHRSIRFSHRDVDGMSFWSPDSKQNGHTTSIELDKVEKMTSGETGELILWHNWICDGETVIRDKTRFHFTPLKNGQMLLDYDIELHAVGENRTFKDQKDGGLGVRVAGSMKVEDRKTKEGKGTILNSNGDKNAESWGKRAEWADYFGPDPSGKTVGIAMFDHPDNLRHPTHWHARTYGLITANRFGKGHFEGRNGAKKGDGDYTLKVGKPLLLRHRLYIHNGTPDDADVAGFYKKYAAE
ncbi:MAG: PmoA family protein [Verrucomicrobiales bacterium]|nr:PmoA family protein [Verrucomicrobiales bacterium]